MGVPSPPPRGFAPYIAEVPFIYYNKAQTYFKKAPCEFYEQFSCRKCMLPRLTKPLSRMQSLSESRRGSKVTKPIFSK